MLDCPLNITTPSYERNIQDKRCINVVFPAPFFPTIPYIFPTSKSREISLSIIGFTVFCSCSRDCIYSSNASSIHLLPVFHELKKFCIMEGHIFYLNCIEFLIKFCNSSYRFTHSKKEQNRRFLKLKSPIILSE